MDLESPVRVNSTTYTVPIRTLQYFDITYPSSDTGSHTTPPLNNIEAKLYISKLAALYEDYSSKWFNKKIPAFYFIQHAGHTWDHGNTAPYTSPPNYVGSIINVHQVWCPETITVQPNLFQIRWTLRNSDYSSYSVSRTSGANLESEEIPYGENQLNYVLKETPRSIFHRKIREAKLAAANANLRVKRLYLKYYKRYGETIVHSEESPLSSDDELTS